MKSGSRIHIIITLSALVLVFFGILAGFRNICTCRYDTMRIQETESGNYSFNMPESDFEKAMNLIMMTRSSAFSHQNILTQQDYKNYASYIPSLIFKSGTDKRNLQGINTNSLSCASVPHTKDYYVFTLEKIEI